MVCYCNWTFPFWNFCNLPYMNCFYTSKIRNSCSLLILLLYLPPTSVMLPRILFLAGSCCFFTPLACSLDFLLASCCHKWRVSMKFKLVSYRRGLSAISQFNVLVVPGQRQWFQKMIFCSGKYFILSNCFLSFYPG